MSIEKTTFYNFDFGITLLFGPGELAQKSKEAHKHWRSLLSDDELKEVQFAQFYIGYFRDDIDRLYDGKRLAMIDRLARMLDDREIISMPQPTDRKQDWSCLYEMD